MHTWTPEHGRTVFTAASLHQSDFVLVNERASGCARCTRVSYSWILITSGVHKRRKTKTSQPSCKMIHFTSARLRAQQVVVLYSHPLWHVNKTITLWIQKTSDSGRQRVTRAQQLAVSMLWWQIDDQNIMNWISARAAAGNALVSSWKNLTANRLVGQQKINYFDNWLIVSFNFQEEIPPKFVVFQMWGCELCCRNSSALQNCDISVMLWRQKWLLVIDNQWITGLSIVNNWPQLLFSVKDQMSNVVQ